MVKNKKEHKILKVIHTNLDMLRFAFKQKHGRRYIVVKTIMSALNTALAVFYAILPGVIVNELSGQKRWNYLILDVGVLTLITIIDYFLNKQINFFLHNVIDHHHFKPNHYYTCRYMCKRKLCCGGEDQLHTLYIAEKSGCV